MNTKTKSVIFLLLVIAFVFNNAFAFELGVGTHFGQGRGNPASAFEWMKSAGMKSFRDEIYWDSVEHQPGKFEPNKNARKSLEAYSEAKNAGINPVLILSYGNKLYDGRTQLYTAQGRTAFANYARWLAGQLNGKVEYFEIWNEWNSGAGTYPKVRYGDPVNYVKLASISYDAIKSVNPAAIVLVGALADDLNRWPRMTAAINAGLKALVGGALADDLNGWPWLKTAINAGLLKKADGVSVHLYNHGNGPSQRGASEAIERLRTLQTLLRTSNGGKPVPIYVTEIGWPTHVGPGGVSEQVAAEQDARFLLQAQTVQDLAGIWWYDLEDDGDNPNDREDNFGLLRTSLKEKPAGCRLRSLAPFMRQSSLLQNISNGDAQALMFRGNDGRTLLAVWAGDGYGDNDTDSVSNIVVRGSFGSVKAFDQACGDRVIEGFKGATANAIQIRAGTYPTLVWLEGKVDLLRIERD